MSDLSYEEVCRKSFWTEILGDEETADLITRALHAVMRLQSGKLGGAIVHTESKLSDVLAVLSLTDEDGRETTERIKARIIEMKKICGKLRSLRDCLPDNNDERVKVSK